MELVRVSVILVGLLAMANAMGFHGFHYRGLEEPRWVGPRRIDDKWIEQPLDHFNHRDNRTWKMRYLEEDKLYNGTGPILIMLGGEWTISPGYLQSGLMYDIAKQHGALMFYTEHRYYGKSRPTENMSVDNLRYLNVDQALADVAHFVKAMKAERKAEKAKVVVFGGSYSGNMAAWIRIKYPHLIQGAVASSAPVYAKADFYEYYEVVTESLRRHDKQCSLNVKIAFEQTEKLLLAAKNGGAEEKIEKIFNVCRAPNATDDKDVGFFMDYLAEKFAETVQYNKINGKTSSIGKVCAYMTNETIGTPMQRLGAIFQNEKKCANATYSNFLEKMRKEAFNGDAMRQWMFQTCVEYGYYQTSSSSKSAFGNLFGLSFFVNICKDLYGEYYNERLLELGVSRTNLQYGGRLPDVTNVIFTNGDVDPWHALSVLEALNESTPAILVPGTSHCQDLKQDSPNDPVEMLEARKRVKALVSGWLKN